MNPSCGASPPTRKEVDVAMLRVSQKHRGKKLSHEGILDGVALVTSMKRMKKMDSTISMSEKNMNKMDELSELMKSLAILAIKALMGGGASRPTPRGGVGAISSIGRTKSWKCSCCGSKEHSKHECAELFVALRERMLKFIDHDGIPKLVYHF